MPAVETVVDYGERYRRALLDQIAHGVEFLTESGAESWDSYKHALGHLQGLRTALREFDDTREAEQRDEGE